MKKVFLFAAISSLIFASCKKEVTEVQKVDQAFSAVYTITSTDWATDNGGLSYTASLNVPELDDVIYQSGAVLVYLSFSGSTYYEALPEVFDGFTYGAFHSNGSVSIDISALTGEAINPPGQDISAKIILIDATRLGLHKDLNYRDLGSVEKAFNIK